MNVRPLKTDQDYAAALVRIRTLMAYEDELLLLAVLVADYEAQHWPNRKEKVMAKIVDWPTSDTAWWWMRYRPSSRSKWRVLLVRVTENEGAKYIQPFQDRNGFSRSICTNWEATFYPAVPPPVMWLGDG